MSSNMSCSVCNKAYKSRGALTKHQAKCNARPENITSTLADTSIQNDMQFQSDGDGDAYDEDDEMFLPQDARREFKEQIHSLLNSKNPPPRTEPIKSENIVVNTTALDCLMKAFVTELFAYQHKQMQSILDHNSKLVEENKMLVNMLRSIVLIKNHNGHMEAFDQNDDDR